MQNHSLFEFYSSVETDTKGHGCLCCQSIFNANNAVAEVRITSSLLNSVQISREHVQNLGVSLFVPNAEVVGRMINDVKAKPSIVATQSVPAKRIFVSAYINPSDFKIIMLNGATHDDWNRFLQEVRYTLGIPPGASSLQVTLAVMRIYNIEIVDSLCLI